MVAGSNPVAPTILFSPSPDGPPASGTIGARLASRPSHLATAVLLAVAAASLLGCGSFKGRPSGPVRCGQWQSAARDTIYTEWRTDAESDSGYSFVSVDAAGDTLSFYLQWIVGVNPHLRLWGPTAGGTRPGGRRLWRLHRLKMQDPHEIFESAADVTTQGANSRIAGTAMSRLAETPDSIMWAQRWLFAKTAGRGDTLDVTRTVLMTKGKPYFLVRYAFTWLGKAPDSVRFIWSNHPRMGLAGSRHDVGFAPGFGLVTTRKVLAAAGLNYWACMLDVGNPDAAGADTLGAGALSFMSSELRFDAGSGRREYAGAFVCFNPAAGIVPEEFAWMDSTGWGDTSLDFDSPAISSDTTDVLDGGFRTLLARTPVVHFARGETKFLEYAVGRARIVDGLPPVLPDVTWLGGGTSRSPAAPDRR